MYKDVELQPMFVDPDYRVAGFTSFQVAINTALFSDSVYVQTAST